MKPLRYRPIYFFTCLLALFLFVFSLYLQNVQDLPPCLLCLVQRFFLVTIIITSFCGWIVPWEKVGRRVINILTIIFSIGGLIFAARQTWLQHVTIMDPNSTISCLPDASFLLAHFPLTKVLKLAATGGAECASTDWTWLSVSLAEWSSFCFILFLVIGCVQFRTKK